MFCQINIEKYFLLLYRMPLQLVISFTVQKFFSLVSSRVCRFVFVACAIDVISKKIIA